MHRFLTLAALLVAPLLAAAQEAPPAPPSTAASPASTQPSTAAPTPQWSFGGGISYVIYSGPVSLATASALFVPAASASLEHRLSDRTWLVAGVFGSVQRYRADFPTGSAGTTRDDARTLSLTGGVRRVLTRPGAIVQVSLVALGEAAIGDGERNYVNYSGPSVATDATSWSVGANAGFALDRELTDGVSLRVASPLLGASYHWTMVDQVGAPRRQGSGFYVNALLAPRLELRMAF
jgi:hypothetical protein